MECVKGLPITEYCDRHKLNIRQRLTLFVQLCNGVQHAHQKGIIHRDIKPSNVLVTASDDQALAKVIDFGVARATSQPLTERTLWTEPGQWLGTPEYMSPEQIETTNEDVDIRHYLKCEPVSAGPPSAAYRTSKFMLRHQKGVTAATIAVMALAIGFVVSTAMFLRAEQQRRRAEALLTRAQIEKGVNLLNEGNRLGHES